MTNTPGRRSPHNPFTRALDRLVEADRVEAEKRAERAARRNAVDPSQQPTAEGIVEFPRRNR